MASNELDPVNVAVPKGAYRQWPLAILRALEQSGGESPPSKIEPVVRQLFRELSDLQWARAIRGKYVGWAGAELKRGGFISGKGVWRLTPAAHAFLQSHAHDELEIPNIAPLAAADAGVIGAPLDSVVVTDSAGYELPILRLLASQAMPKKMLFAALEKDLSPVFMPGDRRIMANGTRVWDYRASWALSGMKRTGELRAPVIGTWEITEAGRARLDREVGSWAMSVYQDSKAQVRPEGDPGEGNTRPKTVPPASIPYAWPTKEWRTLRERFDASLVDAFADRVRPDLRPTPTGGRKIPRNVIFYGPPGTGKTFIAQAIAVALTAEREPDTDGPWAIVQFHPSYTYEDFIQGLRPDLELKELRYQLRKGPFLQICEAAEKDPDRFFVLVIDEINRGDPARIFGELLFALEYRDSAVDLPMGGQLRVPSNLIIIGTMNSVDRSVALVDYALRRRFAFIRVKPDSDAIRNTTLVDPESAARAATVLGSFNEWLVERLGEEHALGHSLFLNPAVTTLDDKAFERIWKHDVLPLLEEYFFGQREVLDAARKAWNDSVRKANDEDAGDESSVSAPGVA